MPKIAVLMSTFNGEKYVKRQIESILSQEDVDLDLYIRDDGSTDSTVDIINDYINLNNVVIVPSDKNMGPGQSFMTLLFYVVPLNKYDYYAYADQDDIWLSQKLKIAIDMLQYYQKIPALYGSNRIIYENGINKGLLYKDDIDNSLQRRISTNEVSGCTMVFNNALAIEIVSHDMPPAYILDFRLHDSWTILVALVEGIVLYDSNSYILYRIHNDNTVGIKNVSWREGLKRLFKTGKRGSKQLNLRSKTAKLLLNYYPKMDDNKKSLLEKYANYRLSFRNKLNLMHDRELIAATGENTIIFNIKVLLNIV